MKLTRLVGVIVLAVLAAPAPATLAQDKGKTEAAKLTSESKAALQTLYASAPLAKLLGPKATAILVFPQVTKAGLESAGSMAKAPC